MKVNQQIWITGSIKDKRNKALCHMLLINKIVINVITKTIKKYYKHGPEYFLYYIQMYVIFTITSTYRNIHHLLKKNVEEL